MPFIHIKSLPLTREISIPEVIMGIARDFADKTGTPLHHIHTTWEYYPAGHYAKRDRCEVTQPEVGYPIIVDLLTPDFNDLDTIGLMLQTIASSISQRAEFPMNNIFINHRQAHSGMVFDDGKIVHW